jgi:YYY domain-containing protein
MIAQFLAWYVVLQVIAVVTLPLAWRLLPFLPDRGYGLARILGILLSGYALWIGYSFGLLRFEAGSAWLAVLLLGAASLVSGWPVLQAWRQTREAPVSGRYVLAFETLFLAAFLAWAWVRAYDPAANHTEKPMDLMFINSITASPTYPPQDAWLSGYPISYYYFGYWLLAMLGKLAGQPPEITYNLGQAAWYGLLLSGAFALGYNLAAAAGRRFGPAAGGGFVAALLVGMSANLQGLLEWLYAQGAPVGWIGTLLGSPNFPEQAAVTHNWYIDFSWWWWRSSRALADVDLAGNHVEVIDEFPAFSYVLGDNHPHMLAMPFAILVIGLALNLFLAPARRRRQGAGAAAPPLWRRLYEEMPLGWGGWLVTTIAVGGLLFLNTWDFPALWLLLVLVILAVLLRRCAHQAWGFGQALGGAALGGFGLAAGAVVLYLPYFLTAQSQAGGIVPNLFNPTRVGQFVAMFGIALLLLLALLLLAWQAVRPNWRQVGASLLVVYGLPILFLAAAVLVVTTTDAGKELLARMPLPDDAPGHLALMGARWSAQLWTFVLAGGMLGLTTAAAYAHLRAAGEGPQAEDAGLEVAAGPAVRRATGVGDPLLFVLFLAAIGLLLVYAPEFVFLRDNFGTRMNTVFKFYYQAWLLFGLAGAFTISVALGGGHAWRGWRVAPSLLSAAALLLAAASTTYLLAGAYSKTLGFGGQPTFDATAYLVNGGQNELAALRWIRANTQPGDLIVEGKGASYRADLSRVSTMTGRPTLLGWDGHEAQWRGQQYGEMADGRAQALEIIYRGGSAEQLALLIETWGIDYIYVGPSERAQYGVTPTVEALLRQVTDPVFESGDVRIYRARTVNGLLQAD